MPGMRSFGPRGFLTEEEKQNMPKVTKSLLVRILSYLKPYPEKNDAFIGWFMVSATHHRKGIGSQLFADVRAAMKAQGFTHLTLNCPAAAEDAIAFWENQGFRGTVSPADENTVIMSRDIV